MTPLTDYERGMKEGRIDALLDEHTARLNKINGSVDRFAKASEALAKTMNAGFEKLGSEIRTLQEAGRIAEERVKVAADTLAAETERRRAELESSLETADRSWSKGYQLVALALTAGSTLGGLYLIFH